MSDHVIGFVGAITSKTAGKNNNLMYSICVEEEGRDDEWYGFGWDEPEFTKGAEIEFDIKWNGDYANVDNDTLNVIAEGEAKRSSGGGRGRSSGGGGRSSGRSSGGGRGAGGGSKPSRGSKPAARGGKAKPAANDTTMSKDDWNKKDQMIRRQACMNTAINLVKLLNEAGVLPAIKKKSEGVDSLIALCDEEAERLYDQYEEQVYGGGTSKRGNTRGSDNEYSDDIPE